jgi:MFS family permease
MITALVRSASRRALFGIHLTSVQVSLETFVVSLASSTYAGGISDLVHHFPGYSEITYISGLSVFVLGFALGPLVFAPLSEVAGRRRLFIISYVLFTAFNAGLVASQNLTTVIVLRFLSGCAGVCTVDYRTVHSSHSL